MPQKLKVFRTAAGFYDAYVAAPSQKAALEAWGSDTNLFAMGTAERVEDPELMTEPLAHPGEVVRRLRGTAAEHMAALAKDEPRRRTKANDGPTGKARGQRSAAPPKRRPSKLKPPKPRPDRSALDQAEQALADLEARQRAERDELVRREAEIARERRQVEKRHEAERMKLEREVDTVRAKYDRAMRAWR
jgi:hypothetical protein